MKLRNFSVPMIAQHHQWSSRTENEVENLSVGVTVQPHLDFRSTGWLPTCQRQVKAGFVEHHTCKWHSNDLANLSTPQTQNSYAEEGEEAIFKHELRELACFAYYTCLIACLSKMYFLILSSLLTGALSAPASAHDVEGIKFPIPKRASLTRDTGVVDPAWYFGLMQWTIQRYEKGFTLPFDVSDVVKRERCV